MLFLNGLIKVIEAFLHATSSGKTIASIYAATTPEQHQKNNNCFGLLISVPYRFGRSVERCVKNFQWDNNMSFRNKMETNFI